MNQIITRLLEKYPHLTKDDIIQGKCLTNKGKLYLKHMHKGPYYTNDDFFDDGTYVSFNVFCKDQSMPVEVDKVLQYLDNSDSCDMYVVVPHENMFGDHNITVFMPDEYRKASEEHNYQSFGGRWNDKWNQAMKVYVVGSMANMVNDNLITRAQLVQMIASEVTK